jgi:small GTP-binding protein
MKKTGIPGLDESLNGGIPTGKTLLYYNYPGVEGEVFGMQTLYNNLENGDKCVLIISTMAPEHIRENFMEFGWDLSKYEDNFAILDGYSRLVGVQSKEKYIVEDPTDINSFNTAVETVIEEWSGASIVFGSLSAIMDMCGEQETMEYIEKWNKYIMLHDSVGVYNFTAWPYSGGTLKRIRDKLFDSVVVVGGVSEKVIYGQYYGVVKAIWTKVKKNYILFKAVRPGGVKAFIPKILVTGPYNSGKSTFIHALSTRAVSVDRLGTTIALDHGHIDHKGFVADIFGTPGQERFNPILKLLGGDALGIFLVVDSTDPRGFPRAKAMLEMTLGRGLPFIIIANKKDLPGALSTEEIRERMKIGDEIKIVPVVAAQKKGTTEAFETLLDMITSVD